MGLRDPLPGISDGLAHAAFRHLYSLERFGIRPGLRRIRTLLEALNRPERSFPAVHIAGTNGKGSVAAMTASVLRAAGYRVGLYTSPHLVSLRERICVDGLPIKEAALARLALVVKNAWTSADKDIPDEYPTFFEFLTALAFLHFREERVEIAVVETGMGGRWDATNVVLPFVSVLTPIAYDHEAYLGHTLERIAREKAGIIKGGVVVTASQSPDALAPIEAAAAAAGAALVIANRDYRCQLLSHDLAGQRLSFFGVGRRHDSVETSLRGTYQVENAGLALAALEAVEARGLSVPPEAVRRGMLAAQWEGRFQILGRRPWLVLDAAHNPAGARALATALASYFPGRRTWFVLAASRDKDLTGILQALVPIACGFTMTRSDSPRAASPEELVAFVPEGLPVLAIPDISEALAAAMAAADAESVVCLAGSIFAVGQALLALDVAPPPSEAERVARLSGSIPRSRD